MRFYMVVSLVFVAFAISLLGNAMATGTEKTPGPGLGVKQEASQPVQAGKETTVQQIEQYRRQMEAKLKDISDKMEQLKARADKATGELKEKLNSALADLESKKKVVQEKLGEFRSTTSKAWSDMKSGLDSAVEALQSSYDRAMKQLRE